MSKMNAFHFLNDFCALILKTDGYSRFYAKNDDWMTRQDKTRWVRARGRMVSVSGIQPGLTRGRKMSSRYALYFRRDKTKKAQRLIRWAFEFGSPCRGKTQTDRYYVLLGLRLYWDSLGLRQMYLSVYLKSIASFLPYSLLHFRLSTLYDVS